MSAIWRSSCRRALDRDAPQQRLALLLERGVDALVLQKLRVEHCLRHRHQPFHGVGHAQVEGCQAGRGLEQQIELLERHRGVRLAVRVREERLAVPGDPRQDADRRQVAEGGSGIAAVPAGLGELGRMRHQPF
jgi:hypothetical protein